MLPMSLPEVILIIQDCIFTSNCLFLLLRKGKSCSWIGNDELVSHEWEGPESCEGVEFHFDLVCICV